MRLLPPVDDWQNLLCIEELGRLGLERCATARCAVKTMGDLAARAPSHPAPMLFVTHIFLFSEVRCGGAARGAQAQYGYFNTEGGTPSAPSYGGSSECLVVSDADEVWHFHVLTGTDGTGAVWVAMRAPEGAATVLVNGFVAREVDLTDGGANWLYSDNMVSSAIAAARALPAFERAYARG